MTRFRPCIDLHAGHVKQIVGGTLTIDASQELRTNYVSEKPASYYASLYKEHDLTGAHVIMLGPGNQDAATEALAAWPDGLQVGGGISEKNAKEWIQKGAEKVSICPRLNTSIWSRKHADQGDRLSSRAFYFQKDHSVSTI